MATNINQLMVIILSEEIKMVHLISPNLNFSSSVESCDFDELSKELNRWKDALHDDYIRTSVK